MIKSGRCLAVSGRKHFFNMVLKQIFHPIPIFCYLIQFSFLCEKVTPGVAMGWEERKKGKRLFHFAASAA